MSGDFYEPQTILTGLKILAWDSVRNRVSLRCHQALLILASCSRRDGFKRTAQVYHGSGVSNSLITSPCVKRAYVEAVLATPLVRVVTSVYTVSFYSRLVHNTHILRVFLIAWRKISRQSCGFSIPLLLKFDLLKKLTERWI